MSRPGGLQHPAQTMCVGQWTLVLVLEADVGGPGGQSCPTRGLSLAGRCCPVPYPHTAVPLCVCPPPPIGMQSYGFRATPVSAP